MPQASDDLRDLMRLMFGNSINDKGPTEFLLSRGYKLSDDWMWIPPSADHDMSEKEYLCILFMQDEWDYGWIKEVTENAKP